MSRRLHIALVILLAFPLLGVGSKKVCTDVWNPRFFGTTTTEDLVVTGSMDFGTYEFLAISATPSVAGAALWKTALGHGAGTLITNFADGVEGQWISVRDQSTSDITYTCGGLLSCGSVDLVTMIGDTTTWLFNGATWDLKQLKDLNIDNNPSAYAPLAGFTMVGEITAASTLVGDCATTPCLDGTSDGGTQFTLFEDVGESAIFGLHGSIGVDATILFGRATGAESATTWHVAFLNRDVLQTWRGEQTFAHASGISAPIYKGIGAGTLIIGDGNNSFVDIFSQGGVRISSDNGEMIFDGQSFILEEGTPPSPLADHGKYMVQTGAPNTPTFVSDAAVHTLAYLFKPVLWLTETTTPTPVADTGAIWTEDNNELFFQSGDGEKHLLHGDAFSNIWFHNASSVDVTISTASTFTKIDSFSVVGKEDDLLNVVGSTATNDLTLAAIAGGEYEISFHASMTATGGVDREMMVGPGIILATPKDITNVTDDTVTPIVITSTDHGFVDGEMVEIVGVLVNTAANGSFIVDSSAPNTFEIVALDGTVTVGNGDYNEGAPTGDITIEYPGNLIVHREVRKDILGAISATAFHDLAGGDVLALYVANLDGITNLTVAAVSLGINRIGD